MFCQFDGVCIHGYFFWEGLKTGHDPELESCGIQEFVNIKIGYVT